MNEAAAAAGQDFPSWIKVVGLLACTLGGLFIILMTVGFFLLRPKPGAEPTKFKTLREELDELYAEVARLREEVERLKANPPPSEGITADGSPR